MSLMKSAIQEFIDISKALSAEKDFDKLLEQILNQAQHICNADGGSIALVDYYEECLVYSLLKNSKTGIHYGIYLNPPCQTIDQTSKADSRDQSQWDTNKPD